jgi:hypothetical protein
MIRFSHDDPGDMGIRLLDFSWFALVDHGSSAKEDSHGYVERTTTMSVVWLVVYHDKFT